MRGKITIDTSCNFADDAGVEDTSSTTTDDELEDDGDDDDEPLRAISFAVGIGQAML
jgi:hypothetical protein